MSVFPDQTTKKLRIQVWLPVISASVACVVSFAVLAAPQPISLPASKPPFSNEVEAALVRVLDTLRDKGLKPALREIDVVLEKNPNFRLGHLIKGDLLMAKSGAPLAFTGVQSHPELIADLRHEAKARLMRYVDAPPLGHLPTALLQLAPVYKHALVMDNDRSRLYVFENVNGSPKLVADYYTSAGKNGAEKAREGDQRTPTGVYEIITSLDKKTLSDFYGAGAYPLNFPNEWDKRLGKTGFGIWIHGTPSNTYSRPPRASDGCVVLANDDFRSISKFISPGQTPIVIANKLQWRAPEQWRSSRTLFTQVLTQWQQDWESRDVKRYLTHYSPQFEVEDKAAGDRGGVQKRRVSTNLTYTKVNVASMSIFEYPLSAAGRPMMMVSFDQETRVGKVVTKARKRQYWQLEDGRWKIVFESAI
jgi:murein L,D-transpeptidase YafK